MANKEYFPGIGKIEFEGTDSYNPLLTATTMQTASCSASL